MGPSAIRYAGLGERLSQLGFTIVDEGNVAVAQPETATIDLRWAWRFRVLHPRGQSGLPEEELLA